MNQIAKLEAVRWLDFPSIEDARGVLTAVEGDKDLPFAIRRVFLVHHAVADRGGHAHLDTDQVVTAVAGSLTLEVSDGNDSRSFRLDNPRRGVYVPRMIFVQLKDFSKDAVCLALASTHYDMSRSLRSWGEYLSVLAEQ